MTKYTRFLVSILTATVLVLAVLITIALAKTTETTGENVANSATRATSSITPTITYTPHQITEPGTYPFTYTIRLHHATSPPLTTTTRLTVTLDTLLEFDPATGTLVLPGDGTLLFPEANVIVWSPTLTYCQPVTLSVTAEGTFDMQTLLIANKIVTTVEWDGGSSTLTTLLLLYKIHLPLVIRNV